ncbi:calmodulin-binding receptor-like cytoplasmic kinase 2 isoform X1 [Mercurialis annua]|uniref:calmodulin-binding receptor-like cytoplasmic kinase 2 isoform X1 n=1 Tax=Mercurialis annua TaxID=3986 RepID=UPI00216021B7|nr:calmodulin-binding receptor-like cytoplasmic kinase 2 isoform X1 [Mercurialis annua]
MKSPHSAYGGRRAKSVARSTPDRFQYSSTSAYSDASTVKKHQNPLFLAAKSLAGVFISCFTPPEPVSTTTSDHFNDSEDFKPPSVVSDGGRDRRKSSGRGTIYGGSPRNSTSGKEPGSLRFTMKEIYKATKNFSPSLKVGQGGFGTVYKGRLEDGTFVAVKRAKKSVYEKHLGVEFQSEIQTLAQVEHLNLVKLYGFLEHGEERIIVVEYVSNGTLRDHLECMHGNVLPLATRLDIVIDVAHAITYLHTYADHPIIHRDIKSSNILLTESFRAKVADFGFARMAADSDSGATHVSTQVKGTAGYLDPEYLKTYQLTDKSDVYSFGVLLVELVTGRRPIEPKRELKERITTRWAMQKFSEGYAVSTMDPRLDRTPANNLLLEKILELALQCLAPRRQSRPSMKYCVEILWRIRKDCQEIAGSDFRTFSSNSSGPIIREE